jgi:ABC-type multidrug transport system ATPase subunit
MRRRLSTALALVGKPSVVVLDEPTAGLDPLSRRHVWDALKRTLAKDQVALLLTTHSLDEAEALCHRLGIVVDGSLRCLGSPLHLKSKYGRGYEVSLRLSPNDDDDDDDDDDNDDTPERGQHDPSLGRVGHMVGHAVGLVTARRGSRVASAISAFVDAFPTASVLEAHDNRFKLLVPRADMDLPRAFELLERLASHDTRTKGGKGAPASSSSASAASASQSFYCVNLSSIEQVFLDVVQG